MNGMETELQGNYSQFSGRMPMRAHRAASQTHAHQKKKANPAFRMIAPFSGNITLLKKTKKRSSMHIKQHLSSEMAANRNYGVLFFPPCTLKYCPGPKMTAFKPGGLLSAARRERPFLNHINSGHA